MNLELTTYLYILIGYLVGGLAALITAVEYWGKPTSSSFRAKIGAYSIVILSSWFFVLVRLVDERMSK